MFNYAAQTDSKKQEAIPSADQLFANLAAEQQARKALEKQLSEHSAREQQLQAQMQRCQEIDPEKYQRMVEEAAAREEQDLINQREFEKLKQRYQLEIKAAKKAAEAWQQKHRQFLTEKAIQEAFYQAGGKRFSGEDGEANPIDLISAVVSSKIQLIGNSVFMIELDDKGNPKSLAEKMLELRKGTLRELFNPESATSAVPMPDGRRAYSREQARKGGVPIDKIASGEAVIY